MSKRTEAIEAAENAVWERTGGLPEIDPRVHRSDSDLVAGAAIAAYEQVMHPLVKDVAELDALPVGSVVLNQEGSAWRKGGRNWYITGYAGGQKAVPYLPARVIHWGDQ